MLRTHRLDHQDFAVYHMLPFPRRHAVEGHAAPGDEDSLRRTAFTQFFHRLSDEIQRDLTVIPGIKILPQGW